MAQRTDAQNRSIHLYCRLLAEALNDAGYDIQHVLTQKLVSIPWSGDTVKELLWREIQRAMYDKESTTELSISEVSDVYEVLDRHISEKFGVHVEFPSESQLAQEK